MEAFSLPQNGTPPTPKEQPANRWAVSICSMKAMQDRHGRDRAQELKDKRS